MRRRAFLAHSLRAGVALAAGTAAATMAGCQAAGRGHTATHAHPAAGGCAPYPNVPYPDPLHPDAPHPHGVRQLRGTWIGSFKNLDWPSRPGLPASRQQRELADLLDMAARLRLNAVLLQVRPTADALYRSRYEPWSKWLTGVQGEPPGYDPLAFAIGAAHRRGLELHAWFNPFRVSEQPQRRRLAAAHPARRNPGWVVEYGGELWYDPGNPAVRALALSVIADVARRYDIDGIHLDDYFYPYPFAGQVFHDEATFRRYGAGFGPRADWRRHNVNLLIAETATAVRRIRPWASFGVSPFGIWRNASTDPAGSRTSGLQAYDDLYADALAWIRGGWLDYIAPQLYWETSNPAAPYAELVRWWSRAVSATATELYLGQAAYRAQAWRDPGELPRHLALDRIQPEVSGEVFFHARSLIIDNLGRRLARTEFELPAYPPVPQRVRHWLAAATSAPPAGWLHRAAITRCPDRHFKQAQGDG